MAHLLKHSGDGMPVLVSVLVWSKRCGSLNYSTCMHNNWDYRSSKSSCLREETRRLRLYVSYGAQNALHTYNYRQGKNLRVLNACQLNRCVSIIFCLM